MKIYVMYNGDEVISFDAPCPPRRGDLIRVRLEEYLVTEVAWDPEEEHVVLDTTAHP